MKQKLETLIKLITLVRIVTTAIKLLLLIARLIR